MMKRVSLLSLVAAVVALMAGCSNPGNSIKVITFNIRYDNPRDSINAWPNRKALVCDFLKTGNPDLFGLQEALWYQYEAIDSALSGYSSVAVGRDDGKRKGEMNPLFYKSDRFEFIRDSTFWLSDSPSVPGSRGWGASLPRIVTWAELKDRRTARRIYYFNTHFAHDSDSARVMSASMLLEQVKRIAGKEMFIITGDFNMAPQSRAYSIITEAGSKKSFLNDSFTISESAPVGPLATTNGWQDNRPGNRIDYVFVKSGMKVKSITTVLKKEGPVFISDHWPVVAVVEY